MTMDNREIRIKSEGRAALDMAVALLWDNAPGRYAQYSSVVPAQGKSGKSVQGVLAPTLVLFWSKPESWRFGKLTKRHTGLPQAQKFVWEWLTAQPRSTWDEYLDSKWFDGSLGQGFLAFNEEWGHVGGSPYAFAAFRPICSWYGK